MPDYTPKSGAPATFNLAEAMRTAITGVSELAWTDQYIPLIGNVTYDTTEFCAGGPAETLGIGPSTFINMNPRQFERRFITGGLGIIDGIRAIAVDRVFAAMCEFSGVTPELGTANCLTVTETEGADSFFGPLVIGASSAGATTCRITISDWPAGHQNNSQVLVGHSEVGPWLVTLVPSFSDVGPWVYDLPCPSTVGNFYTSGRFVGSAHATICVQTNGTVTDAPYTPLPVTAPVGLTSRTPTAPTLEAIAAELDAQETKLDFILGQTQLLVGDVPVDADPDETEIPADADTIIDVSHAAGAVIIVSDIGPGVDEVFGNPPTYRRLGTIIFSGHGAFHEPIQLDVTPKLIFPIPSGSDGMVVQPVPPATAVVRLIPKLK